MSELSWYQAFFGEDYLRIYAPFLPEEKSQQDVEGILGLLNLAPESRVLDLCCGTGRHTIPMAQRGYKMIGQDLSDTLLKHAQHKAKTADTQVTWVHSDMRHIPFEYELDAIINVFTSFGYLEDEQEDQRVLQQVYRALKPGGLFLLETIHQTRFVHSFTPHGITRYDDGLIVFEERHFDLLYSRNEVRITMLYPDGKRTEHSHSMRLYTLTELTHMLAAVNLPVQAYYGGLDGSPLTLDSRLVIVSRKPL